MDLCNKTLLMGVLNITADSFSDGGQFLDTGKAVDHAVRMVAAGAAIIDVGAESTRPGAFPVDAQTQIKRIVPVVEAIAAKIQIPISIDTYDADVAKAALDAGASIVNDITALADDRMGELAAERRVPVVLMHMQGTPQTMQKNPQYHDVVSEVRTFLLDRAKKAQAFGIEKDNIVIDPGIGFGKTIEHNLTLLKHIDQFVNTGYRVLIGTSRKRFIGEITGVEKPADRVFGTAATVGWCAQKGVSILRVHDVEPMNEVLEIIQAIQKAD